jgi:hypothetical protein
MEQGPSGSNKLLQYMVERSVGIAFGENLLEETREKFEHWSKRSLLCLIEFGGCEVSSAASFDLDRLDKATLA